jgi:hypothetical protein
VTTQLQLINIIIIIIIIIITRNVSDASALKEMEAVCSSAVLVPIRLHDVV